MDEVKEKSEQQKNMGAADNQSAISQAVSEQSRDRQKLEYDLFRDVLSNVNQTLRFQISLAVPLMAACVTILNIVPPQQHQELLNNFDRWVFIPALISIGLGYHGLQRHWHVDKKL